MSPNLSPIAASFWRAAEMHEDSTRLLLSKSGLAAVTTIAIEAVYLSGYVVECSMKAAILCRTACGRNNEKHRALLEIFRDRIKHSLEALKHQLALKSIHFQGVNQNRLRVFISSWKTEYRYLQGNERFTNEEAREYFESAVGLKNWLRNQV